MRTAFSRLVSSLIVLGLITNATLADTLYEQTRVEVTGSNAIGVSSNKAFDTPDLEFRSRTFDNFSLSANSTITGLSWVGAFTNEFNPSPDLAFRGQIDFEIEIFPNQAGNSPNLSASVFAASLDGGLAGMDDSTDLSASVLPGLMQKDGGVVVAYDTAWDAFDLAAGDYWLSIVASQTFPSPFPGSPLPHAHLDPSWTWVRGNGGDGVLYNFDEQFGDIIEPGARFSDGCPSPCDTAFAILGTANVETLLGDFDNNLLLDARDIDLLAAELRAGTNNAAFDLNGDSLVNTLDHTMWVEDLYGTLFGDADLNKAVRFPDFLALAQGFGLPGGWASGDFDASGDVAFADFLRLSNNFGNTASAAAGEPAAASVPEPSTGVNLLFGLLIVYFLKNRSQQRKNP